MINNVEMLTTILMIVAGIMVLLLVVLAIIYFKMKIEESGLKEKREKKELAVDTTKKDTKTTTKQYSVKSVFDFMEFDKIEDNMIVQKNGKRYLMVVDCQGINYDLMSQEEKVAVEEGFSQFLNTLTTPIQIYTQTRKINLEQSLQNYREKVGEIENAYNRQQIKYNQLLKNTDTPDKVLKSEYYELVRNKNLLDYGKDIIYNTERMSLNKNILNKKYYIVLSTYIADLTDGKLDKEEEKERAFSDLYTKAQSIIRALSISDVIGKIMSSTELADLLYVAYNRDEAEEYGMDKAIRAKYDELYVTAPDYMDQKIKLLNEDIDRKAYEKANQKVIEVQTEKQKQYNETKENLDDIISNLAQFYIQQNQSIIGSDVAYKAQEKLQEEDKKRKEKKENVQEKNTGKIRNRA